MLVLTTTPTPPSTAVLTRLEMSVGRTDGSGIPGAGRERELAATAQPEEPLFVSPWFKPPWEP